MSTQTATRKRRTNGSNPNRSTRQASKSKSLSKDKIEQLQKTELAFISNPAFRKPSEIYPDGPGEFIDRIESGHEATDSVSVGGLPAHLARMCATPLLEPKQESELFKRMNFCKHQANALRSKLHRKPELAEEVVLQISRAERIRNYLVQANTRLVMSIARKFADARNSFDDLLSQGVASLMHAIEKFDYDRGYRFSTYATCAVRRDLYRMVMGRKKEQTRFNTGTGEQLDATPDSREVESPSAEAEWNHLNSALTDMLGQLDDREKMIIVKRYGLDTQTGKKISYSKLGEKLGISKERVRQLANRAMDKLRIRAEDHNLKVLLA